MVGKQLKMRPGLIRRMLGEGHEVENHTLSHGSLRHMPEERQKEEIGSVHAALRELGGEPRFIRPPYGRYDATTVEIAREEGAGLMFCPSTAWTGCMRKHREYENLDQRGRNCAAFFCFTIRTPRLWRPCRRYWIVLSPHGCGS